MLLKTEVWYDKILTHTLMSVQNGLSFQYNAVHCIQKTNFRNTLHMQISDDGMYIHFADQDTFSEAT